MRYTFFLLSLLCLLVSGCKGIFAFPPLAGDHWRVVLGADDPKLTPDSAAIIGGVLAQRLHLTLYRVEPESRGWPVSIAPLSGVSGVGNIAITIIVDRRTSEVDIESRYSEHRFFGNPPDEPKIERDMSQQVLPILKELYPHSTATPYIRYAGPLGP
jgi:hypothetical protein